MTLHSPLPRELLVALDGRFDSLREIGRGGMGIVYAGRDMLLERYVAIKVINEPVINDVVRQRFLREARAAARLKHRSIVPIYLAEERNGLFFLVMEYVDGITLSRRLKDETVLLPKDAVPILHDVAEALHAAHAAGVIHRDIKPDNILLDKQSGRAMLTDFGIARRIDSLKADALTRTGQVLGTIAYMSPEQVSAGVVDERSDLYSLGVVGFEILSGHLPFQGPVTSVILAHVVTPAPPLSSLAPNVPAALCAAIDRCLSKDPAQRFASGHALAVALADSLEDRVIILPTSFPRERTSGARNTARDEPVEDRKAVIESGPRARPEFQSLAVAPPGASKRRRLSSSVVKFNRGFLSVTGLGGGPYFQLVASKLLVTNHAADAGDVAVQTLSPALAGQHSLAATFAGNFGLGSGYAEVGGTLYQKVYYTGGLHLRGSLLLADTSRPHVIVTGAFTLNGSIQGFLTNPNVDISPALFDAKVIGQGTAVLELTTMIDNGVRIFEFSRITYGFA